LHREIFLGFENGDKIENENHSTQHKRSPEIFPTGAIFAPFCLQCALCGAK
jgi:hypothetical protein